MGDGDRKYVVGGMETGSVCGGVETGSVWWVGWRQEVCGWDLDMKCVVLWWRQEGCDVWLETVCGVVVENKSECCRVGDRKCPV